MIAAIIYTFWAFTLALQAAILFHGFRRSLIREYGCFFAYTLYSVVRSGVLFVFLRLHHADLVSYAAYFYLFWVTDIISMILCVSVAHSVIQRLFRDFEVLRRYSSIAFGLALIGLLIGAIAMSGVAQGNERAWLGATLILNRSLLFVQVGLVLLTCAFSTWAALPWRSDVNFGIALGFGIQASVEIIAVTMRTEVGSSLNITYQILRSVSYVVALSIWFLYIRAPRAQQKSGEHLQTTMDLESWNRTLAEMLTK